MGIGASSSTLERICFLSNPRSHFLSSKPLIVMQPLCKIAMVTGAASGFGLATAKRLLAIGYKVACCDTAFSHSTPDEAFLDQLEEPENAMFFGMNPLSTNDVPAARFAHSIDHFRSGNDPIHMWRSAESACQQPSLRRVRRRTMSQRRCRVDDQPSALPALPVRLPKRHRKQRRWRFQRGASRGQGDGGKREGKGRRERRHHQHLQVGSAEAAEP